MSKQLPEPMQTGETWDQTGFEPDLTSDISGRAMANWISAVSGNFNTKANWSPHRAPIYSTVHKDNAILTVAGANYTVTVTTNEDIKGLQLVWSRGMEAGINQPTPIIHNGVMFLGNPNDVIQAIDAVTGDRNIRAQSSAK